MFISCSATDIWGKFG